MPRQIQELRCRPELRTRPMCSRRSSCCRRPRVPDLCSGTHGRVWVVGDLTTGVGTAGNAPAGPAVYVVRSSPPGWSNHWLPALPPLATVDGAAAAAVLGPAIHCRLPCRNRWNPRSQLPSHHHILSGGPRVRLTVQPGGNGSWRVRRVRLFRVWHHRRSPDMQELATSCSCTRPERYPAEDWV